VRPTSDLSPLPLALQYLAKDPLSQNYRDSIGFKTCNKRIESVMVKVNLKASSAGRVQDLLLRFSHFHPL
jgi:hypothetical protein